MAAFLELLQMAFISMLTIFLNPFFWIVIFLVYVQYKRMYQMRIKILGESQKSIKDMIFNSALAGVFGGIAGTVMMMVLGVTIEEKDFGWIIPLALLLMLINIRYICFSYAGGILALSSLILGFPKINVSSVIAIVAILHLIESLLIYFDGYKDAVPIFTEDKRHGVVGGFTLQRFWPIPFEILILVTGVMEGAREVNLPDWWPIFKANMDIKHLSLQIATVVAALGYGDIALSSTPEDKCKKSAKRLFAYSVVLLILAVISTKFYIFKFVAALFSPLGHEYLIIYGQKEEKKAVPLFRRHTRGVTVLDVNEDGAGRLMGLKSADVIIKINNYFVHDKEDLQEVLKEYPPYIWIEAIDKNGKLKNLEHRNYQTGINSLGIVIVPREADIVFDTQTSVSILRKGIKKIFSKKNKTM